MNSTQQNSAIYSSGLQNSALRSNFRIETLWNDKKVYIYGKNDCTFILNGPIEISDESGSVRINGYQMWNTTLNAELKNQTDRIVYHGNLVNFQPEGEGSLLYEDNKIEYKGYFRNGKPIGYFRIFDHNGKTNRAEYYDDQGQQRAFNNQNEINQLLDKCEDAKIKNRESLSKQYKAQNINNFATYIESQKNNNDYDKFIETNRQIIIELQDYKNTLKECVNTIKLIQLSVPGYIESGRNMLNLENQPNMKEEFLQNLENRVYFQYNEFNLSNIKLNDKDVQRICNAIKAKKIKDIQKLLLRKNQITKLSIISLIKTQELFQSLIDLSEIIIVGDQLDLSQQQIGNNGIKILIQILKTNLNITHLNLRDNGITDKELILNLGKTLRDNQKVVELDLRGNQFGIECYNKLREQLRIRILNDYFN